jgi:hypothetical protein
MGATMTCRSNFFYRKANAGALNATSRLAVSARDGAVELLGQHQAVQPSNPPEKVGRQGWTAVNPHQIRLCARSVQPSNLFPVRRAYVMRRRAQHAHQYLKKFAKQVRQVGRLDKASIHAIFDRPSFLSNLAYVFELVE